MTSKLSLSTIREMLRYQKDRADAAYSVALREEVAALRREYPMWTLQVIADAIGVSRERIRQLLKSENMPTAAAKEPTVRRRPHSAKGLLLVTLTCGSCGVAFERLARTHGYNQKRGIVGTYCTQDCQRVAFGELQHQRRAHRTECSKGHPLTPQNIRATTTTGPTGRVYKGRLCQTCNNAYHREYYRRNKQRSTEITADDNSTE
jgi:hypothetical protein